MKIRKLIEQARELGACNGAILSLLSCTSYEEIKSNKDCALDWVIWATQHKLIPSKFLEAYVATRHSAWKDYKAVEQPARKAYEAVEQPARKAYEATRQSAWEAYEAIQLSACEAYNAVERSAWKDYKAVERSACEAYKAVEQSALTQMFEEIEKWIEAQ